MTELRFVSQPPSKPHIAQIQDYVYEHAIKETYVYHAEVGIDSGHTVNLGCNEPGYNKYLVFTNTPHGINYFVCRITKFSVLRIR